MVPEGAHGLGNIGKADLSRLYERVVAFLKRYST